METMAEDWREEFERWMEPFKSHMGHVARRRGLPLVAQGLIGRSERKNVTRMAGDIAPGCESSLHHFLCTSNWDHQPLLKELAVRANEMLGGEDANLIVDDTAIVKKGKHSAGVGHQYCGELGKKANCQSLVTLTLARRQTPVCIGMALFLPESWNDDLERRRASKIPKTMRHLPKWKIALNEIRRVMEAGVRFGDVLADAGYGVCSEFRRGLDELGCLWTVGVLPTVNVYPVDVEVIPPSGEARLGRPQKHGTPSVQAVSAEKFIISVGSKAWSIVRWRKGTRGVLAGRFATARVRIADGSGISRGQRLPGREAWLVAEERGDEYRYYLSNRSAKTSRLDLIRSVKARWACEQVHEQMKQELGLNHFEGRSLPGLNHHVTIALICYAFLQHLRLSQAGKKNPGPRSAASAQPPGDPN